MNIAALKRHIVAELKSAGVEEAEARRESELIVEDVTGLKLSQQVLEGGRRLDNEHLQKAQAVVARRRERVPLQYCLGYAYFMGRKFYVEPGVFIPRPDTEHLVQYATTVLRPGMLIGEIGTGSGAIVTSLLLAIDDLTAVGVDASGKAVEVTLDNAQRHGVAGRLTMLQGDWRSVLPGDLDGIICNPPYIPRSQQASLAPEIRLHEPELALYGEDSDGLGFYRQLSSCAAAHMKPGTRLILELGDGQWQAVAGIFRQQGWLNPDMQKDIQGIARVFSAQSPLTGSQKEINC